MSSGFDSISEMRARNRRSQAAAAAGSRPGFRRGVPQSEVGAAALTRPAAVPGPGANDPAVTPELPSSRKEAAPEAPAGPAPEAARPSLSRHESSTAAPAKGELVRAVLYLADSDDRHLTDVSYAGRSASPRVDVTRSAVVRLALARLRESMSDAEIVAAIGAAGTVGEAGGRPRR